MSLGDKLRDGSLWHRNCADLINDGSVHWLGATGGSSNTYTATPDRPVNEYRAGNRYMLKSDRASTGSITLNISGKGARAVKDWQGKTLTGNDPDWEEDEYILLYDDGTDLIMPLHATLQSYSPTYTAVGGGSFSSITRDKEHYREFPRYVWVEAQGRGTISGTVSYIQITLPVATNGDLNALLASRYRSGGFPDSALCYVTGTSARIVLPSGDWAIGPNTGPSICGWYRK